MQINEVENEITRAEELQLSMPQPIQFDADNRETAQAQINALQMRLFNICAVYQKLRPVLKFVRGLLFFKPKWQSIINAAIESLDQSCNTEN